MTEVTLGGSSQAFRCFRCGGFWLDSWAVNRITSQSLAVWRRIGIDPKWLTQGKNECPQDGLRLETYRGESIPPNMTVERCVRCGKWWFSRDTLFDYKPALEAKVNYQRLWGITSSLSSMALPVLGVAILITGIVTGLVAVQQKQRVTSQAFSGIQDFAATYMGEGEVVITFKTGLTVSTIEYRLSDQEWWQQAPAENVMGIYRVILEDMEEGRQYQVKVMGMEYGLIVK
jgi:hypothetical protein